MNEPQIESAVVPALLEKNGFRYCGIIHVTDGSERLAYQLEAPAR